MKIILHFSTWNCLLFPCEKFQFCDFGHVFLALFLVISLLCVSSKGPTTCSCLQVPKLEQSFVK